TIIPTNPLVVGQFAGVYGHVSAQGRYAYAAGDSAGLNILDLGANFATPPAILSQPLNVRVLPGSSTNFFVAASGTVPLSYQWSFNGTNISGANDEVLTFSNIQVGPTGICSVIISNSLGVVVSSNALLSVDSPPVVTMTAPDDSQVFYAPANIAL